MIPNKPVPTGLPASFPGNDLPFLKMAVSEYIRGCKESYKARTGLLNLCKYYFYSITHFDRHSYSRAVELCSWLQGDTKTASENLERYALTDQKTDLYNHLIYKNLKLHDQQNATCSLIFAQLLSMIGATHLPATDRKIIIQSLIDKIRKKSCILQKSELQDACRNTLLEYLEKFALNMLRANTNIWHDVHSSLNTSRDSNDTPLQNFTKLTLSVAALVQVSPFEKLAYHSFFQQKATVDYKLRQVKSMIADLSNLSGASPSLRDTMTADLYLQCSILNQHLDFIDEYIKNDFSNMENLRTQQVLKLNTAIEILKNVIADTEKNRQLLPGKKAIPDQEIKKYQRQLRLFENQKNALKIETGAQPSPSHFSQTLNQYENDIKAELKASGLSSTYLRKNWKKTRTVLLNETGFKTVNKSMLLRKDNDHIRCNSRINPAALMRFYPGQLIQLTQATQQNTPGRDPFEQSYAGKARSSGTNSITDHALNLQQTSLHTIDKNGSPQELFLAIRSGATAAQKLTNPAQRAKAADNWAREIATAALIQKLTQSSTACMQMNNGEPVTLRLGSTSLLTPDLFRHKLHIHHDERAMQRELYQALHNLARPENSTLTVYEANGTKHKIKVALDVATVNQGVNIFALNNSMERILHSRAEADKYTEEGLDKVMGHLDPATPLGGWAGEWLADNPTHCNQSIVKQLCHQIQRIYNTHLHHTEGFDAYKLVTRFQLLLYYINAVPHFHCKSGKDRTGMADAYIKEMAFETNQSGKVPELDIPWTQERKEWRQAFMYGAGEQEVLMHDTGASKFKTSTGKKELGELFPLLITNNAPSLVGLTLFLAEDLGQS